MGRVKAVAKQTNLDKAVARFYDNILHGEMLCIDPSSGSRDSMPGYSLWRAGRLLEAGKVQLTPENEPHLRLFKLRETLSKQFSKPDVFVIEQISVMARNGSNGAPLYHSVGVILSIFDCPMVPVAPSQWRRHIPKDYQKTDANDAIMLGWTALEKAATLREVALETSHEELCRILRRVP